MSENLATGTFRFNFQPTFDSRDICVQEEAATVVRQVAREHGWEAPVHPDQVFSEVSVGSLSGDFSISKILVAADVAEQSLDCMNAIQHSDLVPGVYEGGYKLWEGAIDLLHYLAAHFKGPWNSACDDGGEGRTWKKASGSDGLASFCGKHVLELGCGHGLPGVLAMLGGASVVFHDFNAGVLQHATLANVSRNLEKRQLRSHPSMSSTPAYISGDFLAACKLLQEAPGFCPFNYILTSETIYNIQSAEQLLDGADHCLAPQGRIFLAAKSHYFGVGGGLVAFKALVKKHGRFEISDVERIDDGHGNVREVLSLVRQCDNAMCSGRIFH